MSTTANIALYGFVQPYPQCMGTVENDIVEEEILPIEMWLSNYENNSAEHQFLVHEIINVPSMYAFIGGESPYARPPSYVIYSSGPTTQPASYEGASVWNLNNLITELYSYRKLPEDWDGYGAGTVREGSLADACKFLGHLPIHSPIPRAMLASNGEISLYWENGDAYAEVSFPGNKTFHYFFDSIDQTGDGDDVSLSSAKLPEQLLAFTRIHFA